MDVFKIIVNLLVGLVVFVTGMNMMSSGLKVTAGRQIRKLFKKIKGNFPSILIGAGTTAIIQSSGATTVMTVGFLSAGALTFAQGFSVMLGAFLGTTVTGLLVSFSSFSFSIFLMAIAIVGFILGFVNNATTKSISEILIGFGILFFGLEAMKAAFSAEVIQTFLVNLLSNINFPILLMILGAVMTAITQSSSATNGIVIIMVASNPSLLSSGFYLMLGATFGALMPTFLAALKSNILAKRVTYMTMICRFFSALLFTVIIWLVSSPLFNWLGTFDLNSVGLILAIFTIIYNIIYIAMMMPLTKQLEKAGTFLFKDKDEEKRKKQLQFINDNLLGTPAVAIIQVKKEIENMLNMAKENFYLSMEAIFSLDLSNEAEVANREENIDYINNAISQYLIKLSTKASLHDEEKIGAYYHVINDIERIGDHASNFMDMAKKLKQEELNFSDIAKEEFKNYLSIITRMFILADKLFMDREFTELKQLHDLEAETDRLSTQYANNHFERIKNKTCNNELSPFHQQLLSELERVADHLTNVGYSIVNPTGDEAPHKFN